jgi:hypothetical protein
MPDRHRRNAQLRARGTIEQLNIFVYDMYGRFAPLYGEIDIQGTNFPITAEGDYYRDGYFLVEAVPEPSTLSLFCGGIVLCVVASPSGGLFVSSLARGAVVRRQLFLPIGRDF